MTSNLELQTSPFKLPTNRQTDRALIAELRRTAEGIAFDEMPVPELTIDDLDLEAAQEAFDNTRKLNEQANAYMNYKRHVLPLIAKGFIEMTIPDKPQSRLQKYRLTPEKGKSVLEGKDEV